VSKDLADMVGWLRRQIKLGKVLKGPAMLQEKVERLDELGVSGWMGPDGFLPDKWQVCVEHKPLRLPRLVDTMRLTHGRPGEVDARPAGRQG
jgi:hypothetical protein